MAALPPRPVFKPRDLVETPSGRVAKVLELNPDGSRRLRYTDGKREEVDLMPAHLRLVHEARVRPWLHHAPLDMETSDRVKPLEERLR